MNHKHYMIVTKIIFTVIAVIHLMRALMGWPIVFNGHVIPYWVSWAGFLIAGYLAYSAEKISTRK